MMMSMMMTMIIIFFLKYDIKTKAMIMMMMSLRGHYGLDV